MRIRGQSPAPPGVPRMRAYLREGPLVTSGFGRSQATVSGRDQPAKVLQERPRPASCAPARPALPSGQPFAAVWIALSVESTATVGAVVFGVALSLQLTVAAWALVEDATGKTSGIVPACELVLDPSSTARLLVVV